MKKLKLQKALLAICLALPITLSINNETKASENANNPLPGNNVNQQAQIGNTQNEQQPLIDKINEFRTANHIEGDLNDEQTTQFLKLYIQDKMPQYLAMRMASNYNLLPSDRQHMHSYRLKDTTVFTQLSKYQPNRSIIQEKDTLELISELQNHLDNIEQTKQQNENSQKLTDEDIIFHFLFTRPSDKNNTKQALNHLLTLIQSYSNNKSVTVDKKYEKFLSYFKKVAEQLNLYGSPTNDEKLKQELQQLTQVVENLNNAYKNKLSAQPEDERDSNQNKKTGNNEQQQPQNNNKTITQLIKDFKQLKNINKLETVQQNKEFLQYCIEDDTEQYLAMMLLTKFYLIPTTKLHTGYDIKGWDLKDILYKDPLQEKENPGIINADRTKNNISILINILKNPQNKTNLPTSIEGDLITLLFNPTRHNGSTDDTIKLMNNLLNHYKSQQIKKDTKYEAIIRSFIPVANQIEKYNSEQLPQHIQDSIQQIVNILKEFSQEYDKKNEATDQDIINQAENKGYIFDIKPLGYKEEDEVDTGNHFSSQKKNNDEQGQEDQPEQENHDPDLSLLNQYITQLSPSKALNYFETGDWKQIELDDNTITLDEVEKFVLHLADKHPDELVQLAYANFCHYDLTIYQNTDKQEYFNALLKQIITEGKLQIKGLEWELDHPLVFTESLKQKLKLETEAAEQVKQGIIAILTDTANAANNGTHIANYLIETQKQVAQLKEQYASAVINGITEQLGAILKILTSAVEESNPQETKYTNLIVKHHKQQQHLNILQTLLETLNNKEDKSNIEQKSKELLEPNTQNKEDSTSSRPTTNLQMQNGNQIQKQLGILYTEVIEMANKLNDKVNKQPITSVVNLHTTGAQLASARINKIESEITLLQYQQQYNEEVANNLLQFDKILLDLFKQLNEKGLIGPITEEIQTPFKAILEAKNKINTDRTTLNKLIAENDNLIKQIQRQYQNTDQAVQLLFEQLHGQPQNQQNNLSIITEVEGVDNQNEQSINENQILLQQLTNQSKNNNNEDGNQSGEYDEIDEAQ